ncbi:MAG: V-type ATPase subunit [Deltaproteobacteria bacterium]|nr:V-type ATPase subunit [Deltaproteobacteria bacterium]
MIFQVLRYAYGGAKVMAMKSRLLTPEDYRYLLKARDLQEMAGYLMSTAYGPALKDWDWRSPDAEADLNRRLYGDLAQAFLKVRRGLMRREARFLERLAVRLAAENLKVVLRALHQGLAPEEAARKLLPLNGLTPLNFGELVRQGNIPALADHLAPTIWGMPLARGLPRYQQEQSLFPLEMSLDLFVFDYLRQGLKHLSRTDRRLAGRVLDLRADITNILWVGRFREIYGFPGEEIYQYLIEAGSFIKPQARRDLAFARDTAEMAARLPRPLQTRLAGAADRVAVEERLTAYWAETLAKLQRLPPFQMGLPLSYLFLKEMEIHHLITLATGKLLNLPAERVLPQLRPGLAGVI